MEFRELGEKEYLIVSVGSWAVSYLARGIQSTMYGMGRTALLRWVFGRSWLAWGCGLTFPSEDDSFKSGMPNSSGKRKWKSPSW
jgi:hypothetical protein